MSDRELGLPALMKAHSSLGYLSGGVCLLAGTLVARYARFWRRWYVAHVVLQVTGFLLTLLGFCLTEIWHQGFLVMQDLHAWNGFAFLCLYFGQLWLGMLRPHAASRWRPLWRRAHAAVGVLLVADYIVQLYSGIHRLFRMFNLPNTRYFIVWSVALGVFAVSTVLLEPTRWPPSRSVVKHWRLDAQRYAYRTRVLLITITALCAAFLVFLVLLLTNQSFAPWSNDGGMSGMPAMPMHTTFFWYDERGFNLWFSSLVVIGVGRLIAAGILVATLAYTASFALHVVMRSGSPRGPQPAQTNAPQMSWVARALVHVCLVALHYLLMLAVMTYSVPLLLSILIGHGLGALGSNFWRSSGDTAAFNSDTEEKLLEPSAERYASPKIPDGKQDLRVLLNADCCASSTCCGSKCTCEPGRCFCGIEVCSDKRSGCCT
jgi:hypothetical protein